MVENPWLERRILAYAHQGGAREAPSSTLYALRRAVDAGAHALELDVHATVDGHLVVCHDETVDRTTNAAGTIAALTLDELRRLDNAHWWVPGEQVMHGLEPSCYPLRGRAPDDRELGVATLAEVLEAFPTTFLNLDIKQTAPAVVPYERALADLLREHGRTDDVIVASFWDTATDAFSFIAPEIPTSMGTLATAAFYQAVQAGETPARTRHVALQVPPQHSGLTIVDERFVTVAHEHGIAVHVWTIDDEVQMEAMVDLDVDGIISDRPTVLADVLRRRGVSWNG